MKADLSIIVVAYNSAETIEKCLRSVLDNLPRSLRTNVVVVDNASSDDSVAIVRDGFPEVALIESETNLGFGVGNNLGMDAFPAGYYYLHNVDAYLQEPILEDVVAQLDASPAVGIAGLPLVYPDFTPQTGAFSRSSPTKWALQELKVDKLVRGLLNFPLTRPLGGLLRQTRFGKTFVGTHAPAAINEGKPLKVDWVCGAAMVIREEVRAQLGGFDPNIFLYGEDEDLCISARAGEWEVVQLPVKPVIHDFGWGKRKGRSTKVAELKAASLRYFIDKHWHRPNPSWIAMRTLLWVKQRSW